MNYYEQIIAGYALNFLLGFMLGSFLIIHIFTGKEDD